MIPRTRIVGLQAVAMIIGGMIMVVGSRSPWMYGGGGDLLGTEFDQGKVAFGLACVAIVLGVAEVTIPHALVRATTTILGAMLSAAVITLTAFKIDDIQGLSNIQAFLPIYVRPGLPLTLSGGCVTFLGSLVGLYPLNSHLHTTDLASSEKLAIGLDA